MLFVIGSSSELLGLSSSLELWFCILFRSFGVVLVNFPVGRFTRTIISVSFVYVSAVSVDNPTPSYAPVHVLPLFCGRCVVPMCSRPRFAPVLWTGWGSGVLPSTFRPCFVDCVWFRCASVHVLPLFCGRCVVPMCSRPRKCPFCGWDAEGGLAIPSSAPLRGWCASGGGPGGLLWRWSQAGQ